MKGTQSRVNVEPVRVVESFLESKAGTPDGGADRLVLGPQYFGVIDGATARSADWNGQPSGEVLAEALAGQLGRFDAPIDPQELVEVVNDAIRNAAGKAGIDLSNHRERADVGFAAFVPAARAVYHIHDCAFGFVLDDGTFERFQPEKAIDRLHGELRARAVELFQDQGIDPFAAGADLGREFIRPFIERLPELQNIDPSDSEEWAFGLPRGFFAYRTLNGFPTTVDITPVPPRTREIVLASDGFPQLGTSLGEAREVLARELAEDPHCVGRLCSSKGRSGDNPYHDDLSYLRLQVSLGNGSPA